MRLPAPLLGGFKAGQTGSTDCLTGWFYTPKQRLGEMSTSQSILKGLLTNRAQDLIKAFFI
jgi:hypothetical protein